MSTTFVNPSVQILVILAFIHGYAARNVYSNGLNVWDSRAQRCSIDVDDQLARNFHVGL